MLFGSKSGWISLTIFLVFICSASAILSWTPIGKSNSPDPVNPYWIQQLQTEIASMTQRWQALDASCSPNAVFGLTYLYMTNCALKKLQEGYFDHGNEVAKLTIYFAARYDRAINAWLNGQRNVDSSLTSPWKEALTYTNSGYSSVQENLIQGINVHINYDLAQAIYESNFPATYKRDYDRINDIMLGTQTPISNDLAARYDSGANVTNNVILLNDIILDGLITWRNNAWFNGLNLQNSLFNFQRQLILTTMAAETNTITVAQESYNFGAGPTSTTRVAYCETHHGPLTTQFC